MANEFILTYKKPGFPKTANTGKSFRTTIEYVGPSDELEDEMPVTESVWGNYPGVVTSSVHEPIEGTDKAMLKVIVETFTDQSEYPEVTALEETFERDWVAFSRSLKEHPEFTMGGGGQFELEPGDDFDIRMWQEEMDRALQKEYKYRQPNPGSSVSSFVVDLSTNAKMFARGLQIGQENWEDYAPVIRKTTTFSKGIGSGADAGLRGGEPDFAGKPDGYEWRKSADRGLKTGRQGRWDQDEEWVGATKVLIDRKRIYWDAP